MLPASRFAVDAYVRFVRERTLLEAVAASLTELFAPAIHASASRACSGTTLSPTTRSLSYFRNRLDEAPRDVAFGLGCVLDHADTAEKQDAAAAALTFKTDVLWAQLDALEHAYVAPARIRPAPAPGEGRRGGGGMIVGRRRVPVLPRGVRLHWDRVREVWVLLAPERAMKLDAVGPRGAREGRRRGELRRHRRRPRRASMPCRASGSPRMRALPRGPRRAAHGGPDR